MKHLILSLLISGAGHTISAQEVIKGIIKDETGEPLVGANVVWLNTTAGTTTDLNGAFHLNRNSATDKLVVSYIGYQSDTLSIAKNAAPLDVQLKSNLTLDEVIVRAPGTGTMTSRLEPFQMQKMSTAEFQRAACCNLSEAFETNPSVDVAYSDAATGAKQIRLLGLSNAYVQMLTENNPSFRGAASLYGMDYIPGPWMESIQVSKGAASVKNGYEAVTGQINVEYKKPDKADPLTLNLFTADNGRIEGNADGNILLNDNLATGLFLHYSNDKQSHDANKDGFLDRPLLEQFNVLNRWTYNKGRLHSEWGAKYIRENRQSGQSHNAMPAEHERYTIRLKTNRAEFFTKNGYILNPERNSSIALIVSGSSHDLKSNYGHNRYDLWQGNLYSSLMFETEFGPKHQLSTGLSFVSDFLDQKVAITDNASTLAPKRNEYVPGAYAQYTYKPTSNLTLLAGIRLDHHNEYGFFVTPRMHVKYEPAPWIQLRASAGKGYRSVNVLAENNNLLASSRIRNLYIADNLDQEEAWNYGISMSNFIPIGDKELGITTEFYQTDFRKQIVMDNETSAHGIYFYNLDGRSYARSFQVEATYPFFTGFEFRAAYRLNDIKMTYNGVLKEKAFTSRHKGLITASYQTANPAKRWQFDYTLQINGGGRLPDPDPSKPLWAATFKPYVINHMQVSKYFKSWSVYLGAENLFNFTQQNPIVDAENPFGDNFDATMIWGPVHGRTIYAGIRWNLFRN